MNSRKHYLILETVDRLSHNVEKLEARVGTLERLYFQGLDEWRSKECLFLNLLEKLAEKIVENNTRFEKTDYGDGSPWETREEPLAVNTRRKLGTILEPYWNDCIDVDEDTEDALTMIVPQMEWRKEAPLEEMDWSFFDPAEGKHRSDFMDQKRSKRTDSGVSHFHPSEVLCISHIQGAYNVLQHRC
uniref:SCAPER_N domain-containing protein n=1 Tax=Steinernema glaseri TaxID=37863 RepID=A0A1I7Y5X2_9BILA